MEYIPNLKVNHKKALRAYARDYLKEEVFGEGLTRNIPAFSRFFDAMGYSHGEGINYSNIARDCGVDSKTVKEYYQILVDTLMGTLIEKRALRPLNAFIEAYSPRKALVACNEREERTHGRVRIMPYRNFLDDLWAGKVIR